MNVIPLLLFVSLVFVLLFVSFFFFFVQNHDLDHGDEASLLPLDDEETVRRPPCS